jgi:hypothetical protein
MQGDSAPRPSARGRTASGSSAARRHRDGVDDAIGESFPASDPPSFAAGQASGPSSGGSHRLRPSLLQIYLNDHLAAATAGSELVRRALSENRGTTFEPVLQTLAQEIAQDRRTLLDLMARLGVPVRAWKTALAWAAEKMARLKLNGDLLRYSPLSRLLEIEALLLGVGGKASMWRVLRSLSDHDPRLDPAMLESLHGRADRQQRQLEALRLEAAHAAFVG